MLVSKAARRYATALLESAVEQHSIENTLKDIHFIKDTIEGSKELRMFLKSPVVKPVEKQKALSSLFDGKVSKQVSLFIQLVTQKGREDILEEIAIAFVDIYNKYAGIITIEVRTASALGSVQVKELTSMLEISTSKKVRLNLIEQAGLRGGI